MLGQPDWMAWPHPPSRNPAPCLLLGESSHCPQRLDEWKICGLFRGWWWHIQTGWNPTMLAPCGLDISTTLVFKVVSSHTDAGHGDLCAFRWMPFVTHCQSLKMIGVLCQHWNTADPSYRLSNRQRLPPSICVVPMPHCEESLCWLDGLAP